MPDNDLLEALRPVISEFRSHNVRFYIGGSVASAYHGAARSTLDVDVVAELDAAIAASMLEALKNQYYVSEKAVREALRHRTCFNLIYLPTSFKIDIFVSQGRSFDRRALARAVPGSITGSETEFRPIASAEDIVLVKLEWFRLGGEVSERQWDDVTKVVKLQGDNLDLDYLRRSAEELHVSDLLERLLSQVHGATGD
jgi:hypothetical protein